MNYTNKAQLQEIDLLKSSSGSSSKMKALGKAFSTPREQLESLPEENSDLSNSDE